MLLRGVTAPDPRSLISPSLPVWVDRPQEWKLPESNPAAPARATRILLWERQTNAGVPEEFWHRAFLIQSEAGLQQLGHIKIDFAPSYQRLRWHFLRVWRGGKMRELLAPDRLQVLQQEEDMDRFLYHGRMTALMILHDLRVGDVVELAFTKTGQNPVLGSRFSDVVATASGIPIDRLYYRFHLPQRRSFSIDHFGGAPAERSERTSKDGTDYFIQEKDIPAVRFENDTPSWEIQGSFVQVTEYAIWAQVMEWSSALFQLPQNAHPDVERQVQELTRGLPTLEAKVLAVVQFVQDEIRYLGLELGESSHRPYPPEEVLRRRFGDCKDKSLLLVAMLRCLHVRAEVALVNSSYGRAVHDFLPSPLAFDHAIVWLELAPEPPGMNAQRPLFPGEPKPVDPQSRIEWFKDADRRDAEAAAGGQRMPLGPLWVDATASLQGGDLRHRAIGRFGYALVSHQDSLIKINTPSQSPAGVLVNEKIVVPDFTSPAQLELTLEYRGVPADDYRYRRSVAGDTELTQGLTNLLDRVYPKAVNRKEVTCTDDRKQNRLVVRATFELPDFWKQLEGGKYLMAETYPWMLSERMPRPGGGSRETAFDLPFPYHLEHHIALELPTAWPIAESSAVVEDPAFLFGMKATGTDRKVSLDYLYVSRADHVGADRVPEWREKIAEARNHLGYRFTRNPRLAEQLTQKGPVKAMLWFAAAGLGVGVILAFWLSHVRPKRADLPLDEFEALVGIKGWLALFAVVLLLRTVAQLGFAGVMLRLAFNHPWWVRLTDPESSGFVEGTKQILLMEAFMASFFLAYLILSVVQFFRKRAATPVLLTVFFAVQAGWAALDYCWYTQGMNLKADFRMVQATLVALFLLVPYIWTSQRIKNTFRT